jgi:2-hydroxy-6-oxonona-2,4-dienedioate hydrolase
MRRPPTTAAIRLTSYQECWHSSTMAFSEKNEGILMSLAELDATAERFETQCGDGTMVWRRWGEGTPLVVLHGGSGSWSHWIRNIPVLAQHYQIWAPDMPASGDSATPPEPVTALSYAAVIAAGINALIPEGKLALAGFSLGSRVGEAVAAQIADRLRLLVLIRGGFGIPGEDPSPRLRKWRNITDPAERADALRHNLATLMVHDPAIIDDAMIRMYDADLARSRLKPGIFHGTHEPGIFERLLMPVVCITGEYDVYGMPSVAAQAAEVERRRPGTPFHTIKGAGHWVIYEAAERVNPLLLKILSEE